MPGGEYKPYKQYLRNISLPIPKSTQCYRRLSPAKRRYEKKNDQDLVCPKPEDSRRLKKYRRFREGDGIATGSVGHIIPTLQEDIQIQSNGQSLDHARPADYLPFDPNVFAGDSPNSVTTPSIVDTLQDVSSPLQDGFGQDLPPENSDEYPNECPLSPGETNEKIPNERQTDNEKAIHPDSDITSGQFLLLILSFILRHKLSGLALGDLLQILNIAMPGCLPKSKYLLEKLFSSTKKYVKHFYCDTCNGYFGTTVPEHCVNCDNQSTPNGSNFFLVMSVGDQVVDLAENHSLFEKIRQRTCEHETIKDVCCGKLYQQTSMKDILQDGNNISLTWSCDGVPVFSSSKYCIWPVVCTINELPYELRRDHTLLCALWFGSKKPHIATFLQPFVKEIAGLSSEGIGWVDKDNNRQVTRIVAGVCSCDSVARAMLQNFTQFNGHQGCSFCLHPGETVERGNGHARVYPMSCEKYRMRTDGETKLNAEESVMSKSVVNGVKGPSVLMLLPHFDMVNSFSPDYMHAVLLGVVRQIVNLWIDSSSHAKEYYLGQKVDALNNRLLSIKPSNEIKRRPRSLFERKFWKASEWRHFLLIYSGVILRDILPKQFYHHWLLLVNGISLLMDTNITHGDLKLAHFCLIKFVCLIPELYGKEHVTFNVHLLTHLSEAVKNQGPLWATSAFVFEDLYGKLQNMFHGTQHVPEQMLKTFIAKRHLTLLAETHLDTASDEVLACFNSLMDTNTKVRSSVKIESFRGVNNGVLRELTIQEKLAVQETLGFNLSPKRGKFFKRFLIKGKLLSTESYCKPYARDDSIVEISQQTKKTCVIKEAVVIKPNCTCSVHEACSCEPIVFILVQPMVTKQLSYQDGYVQKNLASFMWQMDTDTRSPLVACSPEFVTAKFVKVTDKFVVKLPMFELD